MVNIAAMSFASLQKIFNNTNSTENAKQKEEANVDTQDKSNVDITDDIEWIMNTLNSSNSNEILAQLKSKLDTTQGMSATESNYVEEKINEILDSMEALKNESVANDEEMQKIDLNRSQVDNVLNNIKYMIKDMANSNLQKTPEYKMLQQMESQLSLMSEALLFQKTMLSERNQKITTVYTRVTKQIEQNPNSYTSSESEASSVDEASASSLIKAFDIDLTKYENLGFNPFENRNYQEKMENCLNQIPGVVENITELTKTIQQRKALGENDNKELTAKLESYLSSQKTQLTELKKEVIACEFMLTKSK